ncbi:hypothetical protein M758_2G233800 [Ceratodon purpureus]|uniref:Uncharacterized protein n=1 Tax=Ceratodon purpureus TaxID=3225 RepID=A0A8T0J1T2_CERPU|nr:hypothetical protein KC19_2G279100 [Ceratodon purpureus]KAG0627863.1 hypothetical protein M758_2G233800 [Ceratodon purpureus]
MWGRTSDWRRHFILLQQCVAKCQVLPSCTQIVWFVDASRHQLVSNKCSCKPVQQLFACIRDLAQ